MYRRYIAYSALRSCAKSKKDLSLQFILMRIGENVKIGVERN